MNMQRGGGPWMSAGRHTVRLVRMQSTSQTTAEDASVVVGFVPGGEFAGVNDAVTVFFSTSSAGGDESGRCRRYVRVGIERRNPS
ncbi:MAG: hypothetical protein JWP48_1225 [Actinoallomurus sp.]|nr:hypothetical protein [Actinoallomurus sp.]